MRAELRTSTVPARCPEVAQRLAKDMAAKIAEALGYSGVFGVEFFVMPEGSVPPVLVNNIAPRVHNSGHWTLDACTVNQFEAHIRAIAGWPTGALARHSDAVMTNLLGEDVLHWRAMLEDHSLIYSFLREKRGAARAEARPCN